MLLLALKPQQYEIVPLCGFSVLLPAVKALFSTDFTFKIYVGERKAAESSTRHFTLAVTQQSVHEE